jgi:hypothetical protein
MKKVKSKFSTIISVILIFTIISGVFYLCYQETHVHVNVISVEVVPPKFCPVNGENDENNPEKTKQISQEKTDCNQQ